MPSQKSGIPLNEEGNSRESVSRGAVLEKAMQLFWMRGAETASYNEIVEATGLSRKALYQLWPDKDALMHETLSVYRRDVLGSILAPLKAGGLAGLKAFWGDLEAAARGKGWRGCYLFRTGTGSLRSDRFVSAMFNGFLDELSRAIAREIRAGQNAGDIAATIDAEQAGWQSVAINGLISAIGAQNGYDARVKRLFATARASCGL